MSGPPIMETFGESEVGVAERRAIDLGHQRQLAARCHRQSVDEGRRRLWRRRAGPGRRRPGLRAIVAALVRGGPARQPGGAGRRMSEVYVYALLGNVPAPDAGGGLRDEPLRLVRVGDLLAAVGEMTEPPAVSETTLRAHDAVVRRLADGVDAILPVRFGALLSESSLADVLHARARELSEALALVAGRQQMTLRVLGEPAAGVAPAPDAAGDADAGPGARYLAARRAEWRRAGEAPELAPLRPALERLIRAERITRHDTPPLLASVYHLIDRGADPAYRAAVECSVSTDVRVVATGPWPPYAFAPEALG